jgi:hypothetical protein
MSAFPAHPRLLLERALIAIGSALYLWFFNRTVPNGDALRIVDQVSSSQLIWNPNHLLFDPLGYGFYRLLQQIGIDTTVLGSFEFISGAATIVTLLIFHAVLVRIGIDSLRTRLLSSVALFAATSFLFVGLNQYYFMIQMPFLLGALYFYFDFFLKDRAGIEANSNLYIVGVLLAISVTIMFNNLLVTAAVGVGAALTGYGWKQLQIAHAARIWSAAALVGFPIFFLGYWLSGTENNFLTWLLSYQGDSSSKLNELYGLKWTLPEVTQAAARMGFKLFLGNTLETAGLGGTVSALMSGGQLEFIPQYSKIALSLIAAPAVVLLHLYIAYYAIRNLPAEPNVRLLAGWIFAYVAFNFLWNVGDEIFWFQIVPATLLLFLLSQQETSSLLISNTQTTTPQMTAARWSIGRQYGLIALILLVLIVNTLNAALPNATDKESMRLAEHRAMLRDGDLEIMPGWDQQKWMSIGEEPGVRKIMLMNMALAKDDAPDALSNLPQIVATHLQSGKRVVVARLYDLDRDMMPWYSLAEMGWPRQRIITALNPFCQRQLIEIGGVIFHELYLCEKRP